MRKCAFLALATLAATAAPASAALLNPTLSSLKPIPPTVANPDITASFLSMSYITGSTMTVSGFASALFTGQNTFSNYPNGTTFTLDVTISNTGVASAGTLDVMGPSPSFTNFLHGILASGANFGWSNGSADTFEFVFTGLTGTQASQFGPKLGALYSTTTDSTFAGLFNANFQDNSGDGAADNFSVPEPASLAVLALGSLCLIRRRSH
jgi:hypothetical protein